MGFGCVQPTEFGVVSVAETSDDLDVNLELPA